MHPCPNTLYCFLQSCPSQLFHSHRTQDLTPRRYPRSVCITTRQPRAAISDDPSRQSSLPPIPSSSNPSINRSIATISLPALFSLALNPLVSLFDMYILRQLPAGSLGGISIGNNLFNIAFTCFNFLGIATTPAIARAFARGDKQEASRLTAQALWLALFSGLSAAILLATFMTPLLGFFGASRPALHAQARIYLHARIIAAPFYLANIVGNGAFRGFQNTRTPLYVGLLANAVNLCVYPSLILWAKLGVLGAGASMAITQTVSGVAFVIILLRRGMVSRQDLMHIPRISQLLPLLRTGAVLSARTLSIFFTVAYATASAAKLGTVQVAAFEIARRFFVLGAKLLGAMTVAAQSLVSLALGRGEEKLAKDTADQILRIGFVMGVVFLGLLLLGVNKVPQVFSGNPEVRMALRQVLPFVAVIQPIGGLVFAFDGIFTAGRKFGLLSAVVLCATGVACSYLWFVRQMVLPLPYVWMGVNIMILLRALFLGVMYFSKWSPVPGIGGEIKEK